jgi:hypothetical protein
MHEAHRSKRCDSAGHVCPEVELRVQAAHRLRYVEHCDEHADEMFEIAQRTFDVHMQERKLYDPSDLSES